eukprot:366546-Chlamydomonas_euryale.AAC.17
MRSWKGASLPHVVCARQRANVVLANTGSTPPPHCARFRARCVPSGLRGYRQWHSRACISPAGPEPTTSTRVRFGAALVVGMIFPSLWRAGVTGSAFSVAASSCSCVRHLTRSEPRAGSRPVAGQLKELLFELHREQTIST